MVRPAVLFSAAALCLGSAEAHMSIWTRSMFGVGWKANGAQMDFEYIAGDPVAPLGPGWNFDDWWFRGPAARALPPLAGEISHLPAGGQWTVEIACHGAWTSFGWATTVPGSDLDACPGNTGAYHAGDPADTQIDTNLLSGCALAIADTDDITKVTMDNYAIFSVRHDCVKQKMTTFDIPARMPKCTSPNGCICGWHWLANNGTANYYQTAFRCDVTGAPIDATPIMPPQNPKWCDRAALAAGTCQTNSGAKRPLYAYSTPSNTNWTGNNYDRPGYHANWGFPNDGAQNDIFMDSALTLPSSVPNATVSVPTPSANVSVPTASASSSDPLLPLPSLSVNVSISLPTVSVGISVGLPSPSASSSDASSAASSPVAASSSPAASPSAVVSMPNLARTAKATASSSQLLQGPARAIDGRIGGYPGDWTMEWVSKGQKAGAWLKLTWSKPQTFNRVILYDRPNSGDWIWDASLTDSNGNTISGGPLNNDGSAFVAMFGAVTSTSVLFTVNKMSPESIQAGLAEIQVFYVPDGVPDAQLPWVVKKQGLRARGARHARDFTLTSEDVYGSEQLLVKEELGSRCTGVDHSCDTTVEKMF